MSFQNSDLFAIIIIASVIILISGIAMPFFVVIHFRKKRLHLEEKVIMSKQFDAEVLKTHIKVQEQTMQTIATDLHDNIGQLLSLTTLTLNSINLEETEKSEKKITTSLSLVNKSIKELRDLAKLLHGEQIVEMGLGQAIEQELNWLKRTEKYILTVKNLILDSQISSPKKDLIILRLLQEIINNIIKHAEATHIEINISLVKKILYFNIGEDGIGFNHEEAKSQKKGIGLYSIHKRVEMMNGKIQIDSKLSQGTLITIEIPYP